MVGCACVAYLVKSRLHDHKIKLLYKGRSLSILTLIKPTVHIIISKICDVKTVLAPAGSMKAQNVQCICISVSVAVLMAMELGGTQVPASNMRADQSQPGCAAHVAGTSLK